MIGGIAAYTFNFSEVYNLFYLLVTMLFICCNTFIQLENSIRIENIFIFVRVPVDMFQIFNLKFTFYYSFLRNE